MSAITNAKGAILERVKADGTSTYPVYEIIVARHMQRQIAYTPEFHALLPFTAYATLAGAAYAALAHAHEAMFGVASGGTAAALHRHS